MKAVRYYSKRDIRVEDVPAPSGPLAEDQVLIEPIVCGICGTDLHEYIAGPIVTPAIAHVYSGAQLPQILGHEFSARVKQVGSGITHVKVGDRVSIQPLISPRDDYYGRRGLFHLSEKMACVGLSWDWGGVGELAVVNGYNVFPVPDSVSDIQAAMIEPAAVALYAVDRGGVGSGSTVLVSGVGPIGALVLLAVKAAGASTIFVSEPNTNRRNLAQKLVPEAIVFDPREADPAKLFREHTEEGVGLDVALECVGAEASLSLCAKAVRRQGKVVQVGLHVKPAAIDAMLWALKDITVEATWCYPVTIWPRIAAMIGAGIFPVEKIVTATIAPDDVVEKGFEALLDPSGTQMKILVDMRDVK
ncbi:(R,R)-butanediol dehydrogenase/meso-butanediol dehydrogenase/diacetyl reductase [Phyllobacterium trifolii]|uniref:(R,R)-butanediol dehydrogenase/meso-butanediol dehydrogenase/diacetyl reductase n=1 Tax=Phyllobacterium trifolii TaxID=300193 RepID=A0A839UIT7_9HYPH|nr:2,3-butanediol dehydrogenase [Phyllobacterium trifolii]MBB3148790.1 (R,R)-butanediol dehydrogenase/meso-butanediol dehydrogenase/diacetyl reductase [Phyllobacterium trifolii]